jgi:thiol-disulfide isomerase/thioredoxin
MKKSRYSLIYAFVGTLLIAAVIIAILLFSSPSKPFEGFTNNSYSVEYFMMQSCPHCKSFESTWEGFQQAIQKEGIPVQLQKNDITASGEARANKFNVRSAPTILITKDDKIVKEYDGPREISAMLSFIKSLL